MLRHSACVLVLILLTGACRQILGIDDRQLDPGLGDGGVSPVRLQIVATLPRLGEHAATEVLAPIEVRFIDPDGNVITEQAAPIQVQLLSVDPAVKLFGTLTRTASAGIAVFQDLSISRTGSGLRLQVTSEGLEPVQSETFGISSAEILSQFRGSAGFQFNDGVRHAIAADLGNDGDRDLIAVLPTMNAVAVLQGNGDGTFAEPVLKSVGTTPTYLAAGDLDRDDLIDLAVANEASDDVTILTGRADGGFEETITLPVCDQPVGLVIADVTSDGRVDLAVQCLNAPFLAFFRNISPPNAVAPQFATRIDLSHEAGSCGIGTTSGDMNGDGRADLVASTFCSQVVVMLQNASAPGAFLTPQPFDGSGHDRNAGLADLDGDGDLDVVTGSGFGNRPTNPLSYRLNTTPVSSTTLSFAPRQDLATGVPMNGEHWVAATDIDSDGNREILSVFNGTTDLYIFPNQGGSPVTFGTRIDLALERTSNSLEVADLDGDGRDDLLVGVGSPGGILVLYTHP